MQRDQSTIIAEASWRLFTSHNMGCAHETYLVCTERSVATGGVPAVPGSPGRARHLHPYPPSRRRRQ